MSRVFQQTLRCDSLFKLTCMTVGHVSWIGLGSLEFLSFYWVISLNKQIGLDPKNPLFWPERFPQYLKFEGGPTLIFIYVLILSLFRLYGVMYRGCTRLEAVGLVCNFSGKLLTGAFLDKLSSFFYSRLAWRHLKTNFSRYIVIINIFVLCCFSWRLEAVKTYFIKVLEQSLKTVEEKGAVYQIRRPLGLVFVIYFWWLGELLLLYI